MPAARKTSQTPPLPPDPFRILRPRRLSPLVIICEHASHEVPPGFLIDGGTRRLLTTHRGWDIGIWPVASEVSRLLDATAIGGRYSRLVIDLNRDPSDATSIVQEADDVAISFNARLSRKERSRRARDYHVPFHTTVDEALAWRCRAGVRPFLLSFHSFTPTINPRRRLFDAGVLYKDHPRFAHGFGRLLIEAGFSVRFNRPYSGLDGLIYAAARHGSEHDLPHLELELNQRSLATPGECRGVAIRLSGAVRRLLRS